MLLVYVLILVSCADKALIDSSKKIKDNAWSFKDKKDNYVKIIDTSAFYNLSLNLRITNHYKYSNLFILLHLFEPKQKMSTRRLEFKLADVQGNWLGSGSGATLTYQISFASKVRLNQAGVYNLQLEQNMRDEPLHEVVDCGVRVEAQ